MNFLLLPSIINLEQVEVSSKVILLPYKVFKPKTVATEY